MKDEHKTQEQLVNELAELRQRIAELETSETERKQAEAERERLLAAEHEQRILAETLAEVALALASQTSHAAVLDEILRQVQRIVPYRMANIMLLEGETLHTAHWQGYDALGREQSISSLVLPLADFPLDAEVIQSRKPLVIPDTHQHPRWVVLDDMAWARSTILVPLCLRDRVLGLLMLDGDTPGEFSAQDAQRLQPLANAAAIALENARLFTATRRQAEQLEALRQVGLELTAQLDLDALLHSIVSQAVELLGGDEGGIDLYRPERDVLEWTAAIGSNVVPIGTVLHRGEGLAGKAWETGQPLIVDDYQHWEGRAAAWEDYSVPSAVGVPVRWGEEFLGVLTVASHSPRTFSPADAELLNLFATQAAIAIRNARLYEAERKRVTQLAVVNQVARKAISILHPDQLLQEIVVAIQQGFGHYNVALFLLNETGSELEMSAIAGSFEHLVSPDYHQAVEVGMVGWTAKTGRPLLANDVSQEPRYIPGFLEKASTRSELCVPLKLAGQVIGVLDVQDTQLNVFDETDLTAMETLADQIAVAIENAHLYGETHRRAEELAVLNELAQALTARLNVEAVLDAAYRGTSRLLDTTNFYIILYDPDSDEVTLAIDVTAGEVRKPYISRRSGQGLTEYIIRNHTPVLIRENLPERLEEMGVELIGPVALSWLGVPLVIGDRMLGVMAIQSYTTPRAYDEHDLDLLTSIASQAALALENARLFEQEREQRELAEALEEAAAAVSSTLDLDQVLDRILEQVERVVPGDTFNVMLLEDDVARRVRWRGYEYLDVADHAPPIPIPIARYPSLLRMRDSGEPVVIPDTAVASDWTPSAGKEWRRSYVATPVRVSDTTVGFLNVTSTRPGQFGPADARRLQAFADHAATAIENARLYQETARRLAQTEVLREVMLAAASTLDFDQVLDRTIDVLGRTLGLEYLGFMLPDEDGAAMKSHPSVLGFAPPPGGILRLPIDQCVTGRVYRTGQPVILPDVRDAADYAVADKKVRSELAVPVKVGGEVVAVLNLESSQLDAFDEEDLAFYTAIAGQLGVAMENAQLYQELQEHAELLEERVKERTTEIQAQYARLDAILRSASDGILVADGQGEILQANLIAQTWLTQTLSPEDATWLRDAVQDLSRRAEERPEMVLELKGLDLELKAAPILEPETEEVLRQAHRHACHEPRHEYSRWYSQWKYSRWQGKPAVVVAVHDVSHLKAMDRMKTQFVSNVSHELRTPVTTIKLYAHLMQRTPPTAEKWKEYLGALAQEADRQARLVGDILQISRIDTGRLEMEPCPTSLNQLTEAAVANPQVLAQDRGLTLEHHPAEPGPVALVDPDRMMQVLNNLVANAIHYTPEGGKVVVSTGKEEAEGRAWATATVADTGMGIPEQELPRIFERFFRGEEPRLLQISGTGLGLAIVKEIVELHGGRVTVESQAGEGTTFTVWLPLAD